MSPITAVCIAVKLVIGKTSCRNGLGFQSGLSEGYGHFVGHNSQQVPLQRQFINDRKTVSSSFFQFQYSFIFISGSVRKSDTDRRFPSYRQYAMAEPRQICCQQDFLAALKLLFRFAIGKGKLIFRRNRHFLLLFSFQKHTYLFRNSSFPYNHTADFSIFFKKFCTICAADQI